MITSKKNCSPEVSLEKSLEEMKLIREGKLPKVSWEDFKKDLKTDKKEE